MPTSYFRDAFYQPEHPAIDDERLSTVLASLYSNAEPLYFSTESSNELASELQRFRTSSEFALFKAQYQCLIFAIDEWCSRLGIQNIAHQANAVPLSAFAFFNHHLFNDTDYFNTRAALFFDEGKKDLEVIYMQLLDPHIDQEKKKMTLENLQLSLVLCADGSLSAIPDAKAALIASQNSQQLFTQAKSEAIRQIALDFHRFALQDDYQWYLHPLKRVGMEVHYINVYMDSIAQGYGLPLKNDQTKPNVSQQTVHAFAPYLRGALIPGLMVESLCLQIAPLFFKLHEQLCERLKALMPLDIAVYQATHAAWINNLFETWNNKYGQLCPLDISTFIMCDADKITLTELNLPLYLNVTLNNGFKQYIRSDAISCDALLLHSFNEEGPATLYGHDGLFWIEQNGSFFAPTPADFLKIDVPAQDSPNFMLYWTLLDSLLQQFPKKHNVLLRNLCLPPLLEHNNAIWQLAQKKCFSLIGRLIKNRMLTASHCMQHGMTDETTDTTVIWLLFYHHQYKLVYSLFMQRKLSPQVLESSPTQGYFAATTPIWFLTVTQQFGTIQKFINARLITQAQLELNNVARRGTRLGIVWLLTLLNQYDLILSLLEQGHITPQQLDRRGLLSGALMHANTPALLLKTPHAQAARVMTRLLGQRLLHAEHLSSTISISINHTVKTGGLVFIFSELKRADIIERLLTGGHLRTEHFLESLRVGNEPILLRLAQMKKYSLIKKLIATPGLLTSTIISASSTAHLPGSNLLYWLIHANQIELIQDLLTHHLITPNQLCFYTPREFEAPIVKLLSLNKILLDQFINQHVVVMVSCALYANTSPVPTPLNHTAKKLSVLMAQYELNVLDNNAPLTILHAAAKHNRCEDLRLILRIFPSCVNDTDTDPNCKKTALHLAVEGKNIYCVRRLLNAGAKFDIPDANGVTAAKLAENTPDLHRLFCVDLPPLSLQMNELSGEAANPETVAPTPPPVTLNPLRAGRYQCLTSMHAVPGGVPSMAFQR